MTREVGDQALGVPVLMELYARMKATPVEIDLADLWQRLGVEIHGDAVVFHDDASLAAVRRAITPSALCSRRQQQRPLFVRPLNQATRDVHTRSVTLSEAKGLAVRFFAPLSMTRLNGPIAECPNVMCVDLVSWSPAASCSGIPTLSRYLRRLHRTDLLGEDCWIGRG